jgi:hypothetical protein
MPWTAAVAAVLVLAASCTAGAGRQLPASARRSGTTGQGYRATTIMTGRNIRLHLPVDCRERATGGGVLAIPLERRTWVARVGDDGRFSINRRFVENGGDGDEDRVSVRIAGRVDGSGDVRGTASARWQSYNGQLGAPRFTCSSGTVRWSAAAPTRDTVAEAVAVPELNALATGGSTVLALTDGGRARRLDAPAVRVDLATATQEPQLLPYGRYVAVTGDGLWAVRAIGWEHGSIVRTDLASREHVVAPVYPRSLASTGDRLYALRHVSDSPWVPPRLTLERLDPATGATLASVPAVDGELVAAADRMWLVSEIYRAVFQIDLDTLAAARKFDVTRLGTIRTMAAGPTALWFDTDRGLQRFDTATGALATFPLHGSSIAVDGDGLWLAQPRERVLRRIDAGGNVTDVVDVPAPPDLVTVSAGGTVWAGSTVTDTAYRIRR